MEAANKQLGTRICVSASVAERVEDFRGRQVGDRAEGKDRAAARIRTASTRASADPATNSYMEAFAELEMGDTGALAAFAAQVGKRSDDQLSSFHSNGF